LIENYSNSINNLLDNEFNQIEIESVNEQVQAVEKFFSKTKSNLNLVSSLYRPGGPVNENILKIFESINRDVLYLSQLDSSLATVCDIMKQFVDCYLAVKKLESRSNLKEKSDYYRLIQIEEALLTTIKLIVLYKGYNHKERIVLLKMYLHLRAMYMHEFFVKKASFGVNNSVNFNLSSYLVILLYIFAACN
jgi:hypothetical protein